MKKLKWLIISIMTSIYILKVLHWRQKILHQMMANIP